MKQSTRLLIVFIKSYPKSYETKMLVMRIRNRKWRGFSLGPFINKRGLI
jgi:hypothetical protein